MWKQAKDLLRTKGSYRTMLLHKALLPNACFRYINVAELYSVKTWQSVITSSAFTAATARMADFHPSPGLYAVEIANVSVARPAAS